MGAPFLAALALPLLTRTVRLTADEGGTELFLRGRTVRLPWEDLVSVHAVDRGGNGKRGALVLAGAGGQRQVLPLTLVPRADLRRLLAAVEEQAPPGTVQRDVAMRAVLAG